MLAEMTGGLTSAAGAGRERGVMTFGWMGCPEVTEVTRRGRGTHLPLLLFPLFQLFPFFGCFSSLLSLLFWFLIFFCCKHRRSGKVLCNMFVKQWRKYFRLVNLKREL